MSLRALGLGSAVLLLGACAGEIDNADDILAALDGGVATDAGGGAPGEVACSSLGITNAYDELVQPSCAIAGCHGDGAMQGGLSLEGDLGMLVDQPANTPECAPRLLIDSSTIGESLILELLDPSPPCSSPMPFPTGGLSQDERDCIRAWAESLAQAEE
jgi:hypothetical protein